MANQHDVEVGAKLRDLRLRYTIKQSDLAGRLAVQRSTITRYEQGLRGMTVDTLLQIADIFGVPASCCPIAIRSRQRRYQRSLYPARSKMMRSKASFASYVSIQS
jgi:transcriptional regulator with XRE-family HTH domain